MPKTAPLIFAFLKNVKPSAAIPKPDKATRCFLFLQNSFFWRSFHKFAL